MKSVHHLTSVFNIPEIEDEQIDYRKLYEKEKKLRTFYQKKSRQLEGKLRTLAKDSRSIFSRNKQQDIYDILQDIKSFKSMLPNSVKEIPVIDSDRSFQNVSTPSLLKQWAIYGIGDEELSKIEENKKYDGSTVMSNPNPSQVLQHTARLVFPSGTSTKILTGKQAHDYGLQIINLSRQKLKSFVLSFQPTFTHKKQSDSNDQKDEKLLQIVNQLNPERRIYAICMQIEQFTVLQEQSKMIELKTPRKKTQKGQKTVKFKQVLVECEFQKLKIIVSKRVYCIFSYYPFFSFYEQLLRTMFYAIKVQRYIRYKQGGQNLKVIDSKFHTTLIKDVLQQLKKDSMNKAIVLDKLLDFELCGNSKVYLQLNIDSLTFLLAQDWAYYILSLFTLDVFLDLLTLLMLQQKMVFVCSNPTILTYAIFLFTKVLIRPFQYPYPVVNIIPDQEQYLNAPFPVVYGYLKKKEEIINAKIPKRYKNVYVIFQPAGIQIVSEDCKKKVLNKKSPKLRDRLISKFKKMQRNFPKTSFFSFMQKKTVEFDYSVNKALALQILSQVHNYISNDIFKLLPNEVDIGTIKTFLATTKNIDEDDMNQQVFLKIKQEYSQKSKDPFFSAFLDTQLLNVHIFKY